VLTGILQYISNGKAHVLFSTPGTSIISMPYLHCLLCISSLWKTKQQNYAYNSNIPVLVIQTHNIYQVHFYKHNLYLPLQLKIPQKYNFLRTAYKWPQHNLNAQAAAPVRWIPCSRIHRCSPLEHGTVVSTVCRLWRWQGGGCFASPLCVRSIWPWSNESRNPKIRMINPYF
jgi:hypothetical protein